MQRFELIIYFELLLNSIIVSGEFIFHVGHFELVFKLFLAQFHILLGLLSLFHELHRPASFARGSFVVCHSVEDPGNFHNSF